MAATRRNLLQQGLLAVALATCSLAGCDDDDAGHADCDQGSGAGGGEASGADGGQGSGAGGGQASGPDGGQASGAGSGGELEFDADAEEIPFEVAEIKIEINDTDGDSGLQIMVDAEGWEAVHVYDPNGALIFDVQGGGSVGQTGLTELFFESAEPGFDVLPLDEFLERFPEGVYEFVGKTVDGDKLVGEATLTHVLPDPPMLLFPEPGSIQDPADMRVVWEPVADPPGSSIVAYQVIVEQEVPVLRVIDAMLPPTAETLHIPPEFLQPDVDYKFEVLAIEQSGNQTLRESTFRTGGTGEGTSATREPGASGEPPAPCGDDPAPPGAAACPAECTGGCTDDSLCQIDCSQSKECEEDTITCPADYDCEVICTSLDSCDAATVECPADHGCLLVCGAKDGCGDLNLICGDGPCAMQCEDTASCQGARVQCGAGACSASCVENADAPALTCGDACDCDPC